MARRANGELVPLREALFAMLTHQDIERLARATGDSESELAQQRNAARRRLRAALGQSA